SGGRPAGAPGPGIPQGEYSAAAAHAVSSAKPMKETAMTQYRLPYQLQRMTRADMGTALQWAEREGWNPGRHDADIFHPIDVRGHFMAWLDQRPVASISGLRYGTSHGFIG